MNETITIHTDDGTAEAYLARPDDQLRPGVLIMMDAIGVRPRTREIADLVASWGYVALLPNLFYREGTVEELAPDLDLRDPDNRAAFMKVSMPRVGAYTPAKSDLDTRRWLDVLSGYAIQPFGVVGFCMGARLAVRAAALAPGAVAAVAGFHGAGIVDDSEDSAHRLVPGTRAEYLFGHADRDTLNPPEAIAELERTLEEAGLTYTSEVYPDAPHGFTMSDTSSYQEAGATRAFETLRPFFDRVLRAGSTRDGSAGS